MTSRTSPPALRADTIYALSSAQGVAGVAVIRVSGPSAADAFRALGGRLPPPRRASARVLVDSDGERLDHALTLWMPSPSSFTGEDVVEFHVHGGVASVDSCLRALSRISGLRSAEAGEFSLRAFRNGRLGLTEAEGLADLISARTDAERRQALRLCEGALGEALESWRVRLTEVAAHFEALIDFAEDDEDARRDSLSSERIVWLREVRDSMRRRLGDALRGSRLREGFRVAIAGAPNVGKSSLFNRLAGREAAIVSSRPGATRDVLEALLDFGGYPILLLDLAGLRDSDDEIEAEGVRRARIRVSEADAILRVGDERGFASLDCDGERTIDVLNKRDLIDDVSAAAFRRASVGRSFVEVSATEGRGVDELVSLLVGRARSFFGSSDGDVPLAVRERHREGLLSCVSELEAAESAFVEGLGEEVVSERLRAALASLGRLAGRVDVEDVLGAIFSEMCIGK